MLRRTQKLMTGLVQREAVRSRTAFECCAYVGNVRRPRWMRVTAAIMAAVMYLGPLALLGDEVANAAPIVDPRAPIQFQPTVTQTSTGVPALNISAPNSSGLSVNSLQSLNIDPTGLVLNNSLASGTPLLGGTLGANPNLNGRTASVILAQVTSTGAAYRSTLAGPLEVFGDTASVIISNPNGLSINGLAVTNASNLTLTTGTPQFLTSVGGTSTDFAHAAAVAFSVTSGDIQVNGPPGANGTPGAGIEGTVGNLDLIGQTIAINAPLYSNQKVNLISGSQLVTPTASDSTGITYATASNGSANTVTGIATAGNAVFNANGDVTVANTYANQDVQITSAGSTTLSGTGLANQNYSVSADGDITSTGTVSAGQNATMTSGGNLSATSVAANGDTNLNASGSMTLGSVSGQNLALQTTTGDLTVNSAVTARAFDLKEFERLITPIGECETVYWQRKRLPKAEGSFGVRWRSKSSKVRDTHANINFTVEMGHVPQDALVDYMKTASVRARADFAFVDALAESYRDFGMENGSVPYGDRFMLSTHVIRHWLPDVFWGTVFGPPYVQLFGKDRLLSAPVAVAEEIADDMIYMQLTDNLSDVVQDPVAVQACRARVKEHLKIDAFFESGRGYDRLERGPVGDEFTTPTFELKKDD